MISIGSDFQKLVKKQNYEIIDLCTNSETSVDYPDFAEKIGSAILENKVACGVLICNSGVGSSERGRRQDEVLVWGVRVVSVELAKELVRSFPAAEFTNEERIVRRLKRLAQLKTNILRKSKKEKLWTQRPKQNKIP